MIPESITEEPAQNGHEFFTCGELLSDSAPKLSATMQQPRISFWDAAEHEDADGGLGVRGHRG